MLIAEAPFSSSSISNVAVRVYIGDVDIKYNTDNSPEQIEFTIESYSTFTTSISEDDGNGEKEIDIIDENNNSKCGKLICQAYTGGIDFTINTTKYCDSPKLAQELKTDLTFETGDVVQIQWIVGWT